MSNRMLNTYMWTVAVALAFAAPAAAQTDRTIDVDADARFDLENIAGDVTITTWDRMQVHIVARHSSRAVPRIRYRRGVVSIEQDGPEHADEQIVYTISVPRAMRLAIEVVNGDIDVKDTVGRIEIETVLGDVELSGGRGVVEVSAVQGTVDVRGARGRIRIDSVNDAVTGTDLTGEISVEAVNGAITLTGIDSGSVEVSTVNGHVEYEGTIQDGGFYGFNSHNGGITLHLPRDASAEVEVSTFNGSFESDFPVTLENGDLRKQFSFTLGSGGARIEIETFNGSIQLTGSR